MFEKLFTTIKLLNFVSPRYPSLEDVEAIVRTFQTPSKGLGLSNLRSDYNKFGVAECVMLLPNFLFPLK